MVAGGIEFVDTHEDVHVVRGIRRHHDVKPHVSDECGRLAEDVLELGPMTSWSASERGIIHRPSPGHGSVLQRPIRGIEEQLPILCSGHGPAGERPGVADKVPFADFQAHPRPGGHRSLLAFEEMIEELLEQRDVGGRVVVRPFLAPVYQQPLVLRGDSAESLERAAGVQALISPAGDDKGRRPYLLELRALGLPEGIVKRVLEGLASQVLDAGRAGPPVRDCPVPPEPGVRNPAVPRELAVSVRAPLPRIDGSQMRRAQLRNTPLAGCEVGHAGGADFPTAPGLSAGPLDQIVEVCGILGRYERCIASGVPGAANICVNERIAVRHPVERVRPLERGVGRYHVRCHFAARVRAVGREPVLVFPVGRPGNDGSRGLLVGGAKDVHEDLHAVAHGDCDVALDDHSAFDGAARSRGGRAFLLRRGKGLPKPILKFTRPHRCHSSSWPSIGRLALAVPGAEPDTLGTGHESLQKTTKKSVRASTLLYAVAPAWISSSLATTSGVLHRPMPHSVAMPNFAANFCAARMRRRVPSTPSAAWTQPR